MGEEDIKKSPTEAPQDGIKDPLTNSDGVVVTVEEAKFVNNPNGDSKIDVDLPPTFTGLTKEELMKYNNDPFWVRLRWFLFILFWVGWVAMLVTAIVIIVQAPGCKPPPELLWVEEEAMVEIDRFNLPQPDELVSKCDAMGIKSVYFPDLIQSSNFQEMNYDAKALIDAITKSDRHAVTDLPSSVDKNNPLYQNASDNNMLTNDDKLDYENPNITSLMFTEILDYWLAQGVTGFLMSAADTNRTKQFKEDLNVLIKEKKGAVGSDIVDANPELREFTPSKFKNFLENHSDEWNFYKFNSNVASGSLVDKTDLRLINIGMFLFPGTPILEDYSKTDNATLELIKHLSAMRSSSGIKFGATHFANTSESVIAYTRVHKGTPAYAIALNFNSVNETVDFMGTPNAGETGIVELDSLGDTTTYDTRTKLEMKSIFLSPFEGIVIQFVAKYD